MTEHLLKTLDVYWDAVASGEKTFEVRRDDRGFQRGDTVLLMKIDRDGHAVPPDDSGRGWAKVRRRISWILTGGQFGIEPGYVVMALEPVEVTANSGRSHDQGRMPEPASVTAKSRSQP